MNWLNNKRAYTLAEVMVVLLILTIIFAAFAPLITKRRVMSNRSKYAVWSFADLTNTMDAFYDPGNPNYTGELFFGVSPAEKSSVSTLYSPTSKVVIRSGPVTSSNAVQSQIQFRYGQDSPTGNFVGTWLMDSRNILLGSNYKDVKYNTDPMTLAKYNLGIGIGSLAAMQSGSASQSTGEKPESNTALGYQALASVTRGQNNVAIGAYAGKALTTGKNNTYVGYRAGFNTTSGQENTAIGYNAGSGITTGRNNTFIGANVASKSSNITGSYNVGIGYGALASLQSGSYNTAIGYNALTNLTSGSNNTAIGYNACSGVTTGSNITCIGYNSGPKKDSEGDKYLHSRTDNKIRTYIGSEPYNYGGDSVLEIHNVGGVNKWLAAPQNYPGVISNTTTIINGNLIVIGRMFLTFGSELHALAYYNVHASGANHLFGLGDGPDRVTTDQMTYDWSSSVIPKLYETSIVSDRRLKNIKSKSKQGLDEINKLKVYNYTYKKDQTNKPQVGVIAQDLEKVFPNAVAEDKDGYLYIRWEDMFFASINAIKELDKKLIAIGKRATNVESQISKLEKENISLKDQVEKLSLRVEKLKAQN